MGHLQISFAGGLEKTRVLGKWGRALERLLAAFGLLAEEPSAKAQQDQAAAK